MTTTISPLPTLSALAPAVESPAGRPVQASRADPLQALRTATRTRHERLDAALPLSRETASLADYAAHLAAILDWQLAIAPWLRRTDADLSGLRLIEADLAEPGMPRPVAPRSSAVDLRAALDADDGSDAFCWGMAYVLEGSRLGGQVLYRRLRLPLAPHRLRYLGERADGGGAWPRTLAALRRHLATPAACAAGCRGAVAAFDVLLPRFGLAPGGEPQPEPPPGLPPMPGTLSTEGRHHA